MSQTDRHRETDIATDTERGAETETSTSADTDHSLITNVHSGTIINLHEVAIFWIGGENRDLGFPAKIPTVKYKPLIFPDGNIKETHINENTTGEQYHQ